jgi:hypothetical protein
MEVFMSKMEVVGKKDQTGTQYLPQTVDIACPHETN